MNQNKISVEIPFRLVEKKLLEEILIELEKINGLEAIKDYDFVDENYVQVYDTDLISLDFDILIGKIKLAIR